MRLQVATAKICQYFFDTAFYISLIKTLCHQIASGHQALIVCKIGFKI